MDRKRFIVEIGTGIDIHGEDVTEAACRAVRDAVSRSCLCGLMEILKIENPDQIEVEVLVASPRPDEVDLNKVMAAVPIGRKKARAVPGGLMAQGLCVPEFAPECDQIVVANAAVTVFVNQ
ncbi:MAG: Lin0512 family protein [Deltaproteobacteria bacterium]|nr:Lin0512 family protein [Deltaproteobacteria bacterium]MBW2087291.1 Lin0512 family protein [Deltaproteobacteria bacterium]